MTRRVVITGAGAITPVGLNVSETWKNITEGVSGVGPITAFDTTNYAVKIAAEVKGFDPTTAMDAKEARRRDRFEQLAAAGAKEALRDSGLPITDANSARIGVFVASGGGGLISLQEAFDTIATVGPRRVDPFTIPKFMASGGAGVIAIDNGLRGPAMAVLSACASGADSIGLALNMIRSGAVDAAVTGAAEATISRVGIGSFDRLGAMSRRNDDYSHAPQPFDKNRDGLVMGEGSAVMILEELEHARARGANILAELAGYAATGDAFHITAPEENGKGSSAAMRLALDNAGVDVSAVDYISAHGTGTPLNDAAETRAIKAAFGQRAYEIPISSTKSMTGHIMGMTGALEAIFCALAIRDNVLPPTIHYQTPDPDCDLDYIPNAARSKKVNVCISNAFGFGGHNAVLVIKRYNGS